MARTSECTHEFRRLRLSDPSCPLCGSIESAEYVTAPATATEPATTSSPAYASGGSESLGQSMGSGSCTRSIAEQIEQSKSHWSEAVTSDCSTEDEVADNRAVFRTLQSDPIWGAFFRTFGYDTKIFLTSGELEVGEKFAEGGQVELFHAHITWWDPDITARDLEHGREWVLKVFKKGTLLRHLQSQWPHGMLQWYADKVEHDKLGNVLQYTCNVKQGILLKDGQFAFLLQREAEDLRSFIDRSMKLRTNENCGPFPKHDAEYVIYRIAQGMDWLHSYNIVHRDRKASNILYRQKEDYWDCLVADFECSIGTGFWRAPEILQACKDRVVNSRPELFTKEADIYSYGMTCYEVFTGKYPFEGQSVTFDHVLNGQSPEVPEYVDDWARELLSRYWQLDPAARPSIGEILKIILANSAEVRGVDVAENRFKMNPTGIAYTYVSKEVQQ